MENLLVKIILTISQKEVYFTFLEMVFCSVVSDTHIANQKNPLPCFCSYQNRLAVIIYKRTQKFSSKGKKK